MKRIILSLCSLDPPLASLPLLGAESPGSIPGGMIDDATLLEVRSKIDNRDWAKKVDEAQKRIRRIG